MSGSVTAKKQLVWLITGTSSGFGRRLVLLALARGDRVIASARSLEKLEKELSTTSLSESHKANLRSLQLDVTDSEALLKERVNQAAAFWGRIDVLVNNAGFGQPGLLEEGAGDLAKKQYEVNVFGLLNVTAATLPHLRASKGCLVNIGSRAAWGPELPGFGFYASSKAAVQVLTESIAVEVAPFGIKVLLVAPGSCRTEGIYNGVFYHGNRIPENDPLRNATENGFRAVPGTEKGDPTKAMGILVDVVRGEGKAEGRPWPGYLMLGEDALDQALTKSDKIIKIVEEWGGVTGKAINFDMYQEKPQLLN